MADYSALSDENLVSLYKKDDDFAAEALAARYMKKAGAIASQLGVSADEKADLIQEGMIGFLSAVYSYDDKRQVSFSGFACACIKNKMLSALRKNSAARKIPQSLTVPYEEVNESLVNDMTPEQQLISEKNSNDIENAINELSKQEQLAFRLYLTGLTYEQIALKLSLTPKAVDGTLQRARKKLRKALSL